MGADAAAWLSEHGGDLVGRPAEDAARALEAAGLQPRTAPPGSALTLDFRPARATLHLNDAGRVESVSAG